MAQLAQTSDALLNGTRLVERVLVEVNIEVNAEVVQADGQQGFAAQAIPA